ncbi:hypothetical protein GHT06_010577 [Daphnia sinensis]|uniref:Phosphatidic acid phosphatase type 2/haloperoxidase domain-containing protein n=1 Tax=Daphnia sinensis TaxID=1820382 RepID=A0AAD5LJG0_9CRUS|nr:hypothetical protein GHT06_010577 [Daphnia sinensis]
MRFEKIKNFLARNKSWITVFTLIIVQLSLIAVVGRYYSVSLEANPIKIKCNDPALNYPKAFQCRDKDINQFLLDTGMLGLLILTIRLICVETYMANQLTGLTFHGRDSLEKAPFILSIRWLSVAMIGYLSVTLITYTLNYSLGIVAPNFLGVCMPKPQKYLCDAGYLSVTCTTSPDVWRRAAFSFPPTFVTIQGYLMFVAVSFITHRFSWKGINRYLNCIGQMIFIGLALYTGYDTVYYDEANWGEVLIGYLIGAGTAWMIIRLTFVWMKWGKEPELPYYWNDVLGKIIVSRTGEIPVTPMPMWDREPGQMEQQPPGQQNNENESPEPGQETSQPSSYQPIVFPAGYFTSGNTGSPPSYEDSIALNRT